MSADSDLEPNSKKQNLAADRTGDFSGTAPDPAAARSRRRLFAKIAAASLLVHGCLVLALVLFDQAPDPSQLAREIPVELVTEPPASEKTPAPSSGGEESSAPHNTTQAQNHEPRPMPANSARKVMAREEIAHEHQPVAKLEGGPPRHEGGSEHQFPAQTGLALPFDSGPESFRAAVVPLASETGGEVMNYSYIVGGMLERVKHYPKAAVRRGVKGIATVGFVLDESGRVASISLLRSNGDAILDAESVAFVSRAAPFPPPPPGVKRSFAIEVAFGMGR